MNIQQMMKQAQTMQVRMEEMKESLGQTEVTGTAGGKLVSVVMTCNHELRKITIDPAAMDDRETLEDLIIVAINAAVSAGQARTEEETKKMMAGMGLPAGLKLPF